MPPHKLISFIYTNFEDEFKNHVLGDSGALAEFWSGVQADDPRLPQFVNDHPDYATTCVPMVLHGDGVPCTKNLTLDTLSLESFLAKRSQGELSHTIDYIVLMAGVFTQTMVGNDDESGLGITKVEMWKPLVHSMRALDYGARPREDPAGNEYIESSGDGYSKRGERVAGKYCSCPGLAKVTWSSM